MYASIIVPVGSDILGLRTTLQSLADVRIDPSSAEIIVCNDGGGGAVSNVVREFNAREVLLPRNKGAYAARNAGILAARGDAIVFLDADQSIERNWLTNGLEALGSADYVGGRIVVIAPDEFTIWHTYNVLTGFPVETYVQHAHYAPTANLFVRREVFDKVGLFNDRLRSSGDREFGVRVHSSGFRMNYAPTAVTYHPARGRKAMLAKAKRTGTGSAELRRQVLREPTLGIALEQLRALALLPSSWLSRCMRKDRFPGTLNERASLATVDATFRFHYHFHLLRRVISSWLRREDGEFLSQATDD